MYGCFARIASLRHRRPLTHIQFQCWNLKLFYLQVNRGRCEVRHRSRIRTRRRCHVVLPAQTQRDCLALHLSKSEKEEGGAPITINVGNASSISTNRMYYLHHIHMSSFRVHLLNKKGSIILLVNDYCYFYTITLYLEATLVDEPSLTLKEYSIIFGQLLLHTAHYIIL